MQLLTGKLRDEGRNYDVEIKLKGRNIPRSVSGDAHFTRLEQGTLQTEWGVLDIFTPDEVVELVNRALYQLEYQRDAHKKYGAERRAKERALRDALKKQGLDPKKAKVDKELKGE